MEIFEITGFSTGLNTSGINYLQPSDSFQNIEDGFIYRQVLQSRKGFGFFAPQLADASRVMGIFEFIKPDGTRELLVFDTNFLYSYNTGTAVFDQIAFAGALAGYAGFSIGSDEAYITGASYTDKDNSARFVFTGSGINTAATGSAVFFYDGTNVLDYTSVADNVDYVAPLEGALERADGVLYFNERLNFITPTVGVIQRNQSVFFSAIRNSSGGGDDFAAAGAGNVTFSTSEKIVSSTILGQEMVLLLDNSSRILEITTDVFNPYRIRNIPSVIGTSAPFSTVAWANTVTSIGREGIIQTDGRKSLRIDNKIPFFTRNDIDQVDFDITTGGYDRDNAQFLWAYTEDSESDIDTQEKVLVSNYEEGTWSVYNQRVSVFGASLIGNNLTWDDIDQTSGNDSWSQWDTTEEIWNKIGLGESVNKTLVGDDLGFIYEVGRDFVDYSTDITAITQASSAVLTVGASAFQVGDVVIVDSVAGMTEINNYDPATDQTEFSVYTVTAATSTSVTLNVDSSLFTAYTSGGRLSQLIEFNCSTIPLNPYRALGRRFYISEIEFLIDTVGSLKIDIIANESINESKADAVIKSTIITQSRQWTSVIVNEEADFITLKFKHNNPSSQLKINSVRIHGKAGGFTSG